MPLALMDVSDGLARDLPRMLEASGAKCGVRLGARLHIPMQSLDDEIVRYAALRGVDPLDIFLSGGEDYALLGACAPGLWHKLHASLPALRQIGQITTDADITCNGRVVNPRGGFDHFAGEHL